MRETPPIIWRSLGCPYEAADAFTGSDDESDLRYAHAEFVRLGAAPAAAIVMRRLRDLGVERLPRGPRPTTQANPFQLTSREMEVLALLVQGRRTQDIAEALFLSPRTVGHHITAILAKLEVHSRDEAARKAVQLGIVVPACASQHSIGAKLSIALTRCKNRGGRHVWFSGELGL